MRLGCDVWGDPGLTTNGARNYKRNKGHRYEGSKKLYYSTSSSWHLHSTSNKKLLGLVVSFSHKHMEHRGTQEKQPGNMAECFTSKECLVMI